MKKLRVSTMTVLLMAVLAITSCKMGDPGNTGSSGSNSEETKKIQVGDVVLNTGDVVSDYNKSTSFGYSIRGFEPVGIVCKVNKDGKTGLMLGLKCDEIFQWASGESADLGINFPAIIGTKDDGDIDGSDNWDEICKVDTEGTKHPFQNYPAFYYAQTYASNAGIEGTIYNKNWYIPSIYELYHYIYLNEEVLNKTLTDLNKTTLESSTYWSSSDTNDSSCCAWSLDFEDKKAENDCYRSNRFKICCIRAF